MTKTIDGRPPRKASVVVIVFPTRVAKVKKAYSSTQIMYMNFERQCLYDSIRQPRTDIRIPFEHACVVTLWASRYDPQSIARIGQVPKELRRPVNDNIRSMDKKTYFSSFFFPRIY